jgi:PAS domain S-box-containing protein
MEQRSTPGAALPGLPDDVVDDEARSARAVVDDHGVVTGWSEGARRLLGYPAAEIVGKPAARLLDEEVTAKTLRDIRALPRWNGRMRLRHRDGHRVEAGVIAHHRVEADQSSDWFLVSPLTGTSASPEDERLVAWGFEQSPSSATGLWDTRLRQRRVNRFTERAMDLTEAEMRGLRPSEIMADSEIERIERAMFRTLETREPQYLETYGRVIGENREHAWSHFLYPVRDENGAVRGVGQTSRDITEQHWARKRLQLLNDASARIGSTLDVARTAQELAAVAVPELADFAAVDLLADPDTAGETSPPQAGPGPGPTAASAVRLRRVAQQSVLPGTPEAVVPRGEVDSYPAGSARAECLATGQAVLRAEYDTAQAGFSLGDPRLEALRALGVHSAMAVPLRARGTTLGVAMFIRHQRPESFGQDDLLLAEEITARAAVSIDNARQYTREHATALALQRSLLPQRLPRRTAVEVASRYRPAGELAGVGGDWFDVIPLSGARVALVVGDVVGHGIQAAAAMGRLRTAVRTLADVDLSPDELLTHLDDLVVRLSADEETGGMAQSSQAAEIAGGFGATCLYAVYDPVSRTVTLARAGHPGPAVVSPEGTVDLLDVPAGPPLGLGGLPFEAAEFTLPEGSLLALYTDGLIESRDRDIDEGIARLCRSLAQPAENLDEVCDAVLSALPPERHADDIALLIARTRALGTQHVATWNLPARPAVVAQARKLVTDQLSAWDIKEPSFVTELLVSELVTNAIRHADPPIQLRLIHDRHLICEVSDASSTAPHLRRARTYDEGGRGLMLVAQLTRAWGTRQTRAGKTIWAEQSLDEISPDN